MTSTATTGFKVWVMAARPKTLWASISPIIIGIAMAYEAGKGDFLSAAAALLAGILLQIGANFANDYLDHVKGIDTADRLGPLRVTHAGLVTPSQMKWATAFVLTVAFLLGVFLVYRAGWPLVVIGLSSILFAILYTGGPYPLGYHGWGDLFAFIFFGPVATAGTYYVQALSVSPESIIAGCAPGLFSVAILTVNNLRDIESDAHAGRKTLAVRFGRPFAQNEYLLAVVLATAAIPMYLTLTTAGKPQLLISALSVIAAIPIVKSVRRDRGAVLNETLAATGKLELMYAILFSVGWLL
jgi:1,4-dihydroxy-2-naphthoate octaprenyltransferase